MKNILVLLWSDWKSMRNFLYGFALYARTRKDWIVHLRSPEDLSLPATANKVKSGFYSAIVANEETLKTHPEIADNPKTALVLYGACNPDFRKVGDVVAHVGVSRRLAEKRFSEIFGKSIIAAITESRLEEVARRLTISNMPVGKVAALCGFRDVAYLGKIFRQRFGKTMTEFRTS